MFDLIAGPILGLFGGMINGWIAHKREESKQKHEVAMAKENRETRRVEAECEIAVTQENFDGQAFLESQRRGNKRVLSSAALNKMLDPDSGGVMRFFGGLLAFLLGLVDICKEAIRPGITIYLAVACTNRLEQYIKETGGVGVTDRINLVDYGIKTQFQLLTICVAWWFGDRTMKRAMSKK